MKITKACDYAMRTLMFMAEKPAGTVFMRSDLSKACDIPDSFLGKIMQNLSKANILLSERGKKGGFRMEKKPDEINMHDVLIAVEGDLTITDCIADETYCRKIDHCNVHKAWRSVQENLTEHLKSISLKDLMDGIKV